MGRTHGQTRGKPPEGAGQAEPGKGRADVAATPCPDGAGPGRRALLHTEQLEHHISPGHLATPQRGHRMFEAQAVAAAPGPAIRTRPRPTTQSTERTIRTEQPTGEHYSTPDTNIASNCPPDRHPPDLRVLTSRNRPVRVATQPRRGASPATERSPTNSTADPVSATPRPTPAPHLTGRPDRPPAPSPGAGAVGSRPVRRPPRPGWLSRSGR